MVDAPRKGEFSTDHPMRRDYISIQKYISRKGRKELLLLRKAVAEGGTLHDYHSRAKRFQFVGPRFWQTPKFRTITYDCPLEDRRVCVVSYASYNKHYPEGIQLIDKALKKIGFRGHFVYRIGGWPDLEGGSLKLAHVPYAFKPCFLRELTRLGYQAVLWLDASIRPLKNIDPVFARIRDAGYFFYPSGHTIEQYCCEEAMQALGVAPLEASKIPSMAAGIFGINLSHPLGEEIAKKWYEAAVLEIPFFSARAEQNAMSMILYRMGIDMEAIPNRQRLNIEKRWL